jgi:hypothetical protein
VTAPACICTVVSRSYVPFAQVLVDSIREHHDPADLDVLVCVVDGAADDAPTGSIGVDAAELLGAARLFDMAWRYGRQPLVIACKSPMLQLAAERGYRRSIFLDADMLVLAPLDPLLAATARAEVVLTPHLTAPAGTGRFTTGDTGRAFERILLLSGVFNGGCIGVRAGAPADRFLDWFTDRLRTHCRHDVTNGLHYDQTWLDLVPGLFDGVEVLRDHTINVAYWNVAQRPVTCAPDGSWTVADELLRLFHFSGFDPRCPDVPSRYRPAMTMADLGGAAPLLDRYRSLLVEAGVLEAIGAPSGFASLADGAVLDADLRAAVLDLGIDLGGLDPRTTSRADLGLVPR